jgi:hypothetical protein
VTTTEGNCPFLLEGKGMFSLTFPSVALELRRAKAMRERATRIVGGPRWNAGGSTGHHVLCDHPCALLEKRTDRTA